MKHEIKIISGRYRGRRIHFPTISDIRPTPNRVKETLFNWLNPVIRHAHCLDAFAGSGALGFEALSRGADQVVMIESHKHVVAHLKTIQTMLQCKGLTIIPNDAYKILHHLHTAFDIIFLDPPFLNPQYEQLVSVIQSRNLLKQHGLLYIESPKALTLDNAYWQCKKQKRAGNVFYSLWEYMNDLTRTCSTDSISESPNNLQQT